MQKVLVLDTYEDNLRSEVFGLGAENSDTYVPNQPVGMSPPYHVPFYPNVLAALADGWRLLGSPIKREMELSYSDHVRIGNLARESDSTYQPTQTWTWWLVKD